MAKIIPLGDRVLVKPFTEQELKKANEKSKKKFTFVLPDAVKEEKSAQGKVLAVGDGFAGGKSSKLKVGDTVIFSKYSYDEVANGNDSLYLIKEEHVLAIVK